MRQKISDLEEELKSKGFIRIHRAYLVPLDKVESWSTTEVELAGKTLPIGRTYKNEVLKVLGDYFGE